MKAFIEIWEEIKALSAKNDDSAARAEKEAARLDFIADPKNDAARDEWKKALDKYATICAENTNRKIKIELLKGNARIALAAEAVPVICEVWNKYAGKKHGPKTNEKIKSEIKEKANIYCYLSQRSYCGSEFNISPCGRNGFDNIYGYDVTVSTKYNTDTQTYKKAVDDNNVIQTIAPEDLQLIYISREYINDPDAVIIQLHELNKKAREAQEELERIAHEYNALTRGAIKQINARETITQWII